MVLWFIKIHPLSPIRFFPLLHYLFRTAFLASSVLPAEQVSGGYNIRDENDEVCRHFDTVVFLSSSAIYGRQTCK